MKNQEFFELTNPQKSIWYTEEVFKDTTVNNICTSGIIYENIDVDLLKQAINKVVKQNDSFRIRITLKDNNVMQYITDYKKLEIETCFISNQDELKDVQAQEVSNKFEILDSDLFKFKIVVLKEKFVCVILTVNHIISDSWSMGITIKEILKNYNILKNNETETNIDFSYIDYIKEQEKYKKSSKYQEDKAFWENMFQTIPEQASIPGLNKERKGNLLNKANRYSVVLDKDIVNKINTYCSKNKFSVFNFLVAIFSIYISHVSNTNDFVIGTPILNRSNFKEKNTTGMFVNTVPIRINEFKKQENFCDFVKINSQKFKQILRHQKYSYSQILEDLRKTNKNTPNLYNIMISYQITKAFDKTIANYVTDWTFNNYISNDIDIHIWDINDTGKIQISYDYLIRKYDLDDIKSLHERIIYIINQVLKNEQIMLNQIEIITPKEKEKILFEFNNTKAIYDENKTIAQLFEEQAKKTPGNIALVFGEKHLTYNELNEKANSLALYLREKKQIHRNDLVGIEVNRSLEMIIAILAVLKAGGAYIPIDPSYPENRINYMLSSSNSKLLLTKNDLEKNIKFKNKLCIDLENEEIYSLNKNNLENINKPEDLSYVIYTSGSTGIPKGVQLTHKALTNLTNYCNKYIEYLKTNKYRTVVSITTISFDIFIFESLISLQKGLKLVIANENQQTSLVALNNLIEKENVEIIQSTPSRMKIFVENLELIPSLKKLKYITLAGEQLPLDLVKKLHNIADCEIYNGYGPSETTVFSTLTKMDDEYITIGKPLDNTKIYILDDNLNPVPFGVAGQIYIAGDGVSKGYLGNKELTLKSFITNPFVPNTIMYKTGDLGKYKKTGEIICLGRMDNQIKIRGQRIELEEIETKISQIPEVKDAIVVKNVDQNMHETLCAYYTANTEVEQSKIRAYIEKFLPKYMVPQYYVKIDNFKYTPNGKVDRKNLPEIHINKNKKNIILPRNETDSHLLNIYKKIFNIDNISITDSFFELGGDSLIAIKLEIEIKSTLDVDIYVKDILENPILQDLSDFIAKKVNTKIVRSISRTEKADYYPVSFSQKRIYLTSKITRSKPTLYNIPGVIVFEGNINKEKLESSINELIKRHEALRTYFEMIDENVIQKISENVKFKLEVLENIEFENLDELFKDFVREFDLSKPPLFRAKFIKFSNNKSCLFIDMHHIISDGKSINILANELCKIYDGETLQELTITYKDYATYENKKVESGNLDEALAFWKEKFKGEIPVLNLPTNFARPAVQSYNGKKIYSEIDENLTKQIQKLSKNMEITPFMFLISCYYILLSKYTNQDEFVVGIPISGRIYKETNDLIGMFVNTLPLKSHVDSNLQFKEFALKIKENILDAYKYQEYPFDELVSKLNIKRDTSRNVLFDTMFTYQNEGFKNINLKKIKTNYYMPDTNTSKFDLSLEAVPEENKIKLSFEYATSLFEEEFILELSNHYLNIIKAVLENNEIKISEIDMLAKEEKNKILNEFNLTKYDYPQNKSIAELFEEQAKKTPEKTAIVVENKKLTYKELNEKANSLAYFLTNKMKIKNNDLVGVMVNRSLEMIISILGVLKAGGAYIPIDPSYPEERIKYMLENSNAKALLTKKNLKNVTDFKNTVFVDINNLDIYNLKSDNIAHTSSAEDLGYVIFTSGSTGKPKGVMIKQKNIINFIFGMMKELKFTKENTMASLTTISFDIFVLESLLPLVNGMKVVIANEEEQTNVQLFNKLCLENKVDIIQTTPSRMQAFIANGENLDFIKNATHILIGGEPFASSLLKDLKELSTCKIFNMYGPTETTVWSSLKELTNTELITIGKPILNTQIYILDDDLNPVPIGVLGEIYIAGDGVAKGYLNNEELTSKSFMPNPFVKNTIMYKTGDIGKYLKTGEIICLGRKDSQIKIRGLRIDLEEIETIISKNKSIDKVIVIKQNIEEKEFLTAYYTSNKNVDIKKMKMEIAKYLPRYMVPTYYVKLEKIPYTPNGKVDKKELPIPSFILSDEKKNYVEPKTDLQKRLEKIWEKLLKIKDIGIHDNFFEIGGDSLLAMNLNVELKKISNNVNYQDIFRFPTIAELEEKIISKNDIPFLSKIQDLSESFTDILKKTIKLKSLHKFSPRGVLITGVTGFLGIHVLEQFIKKYDGNIYCIIREDEKVTTRVKLYRKLNYYFGNKYDNLIDKRIFAITGDITKVGFGLNQEKMLKIVNSCDVVINCAANVSHYGNYVDFYNTNVKGVKNIIEFCKSFKMKLYHISTMSVSGTKLDSAFPSIKKQNTIKFDESCLYVGQKLDNVYMHSKFEAEVQVLEAITKGLDAYILRMGNLMPRLKDGKFQENLDSNAFINRVQSFCNIGYLPEYILNEPLEFTPIDVSAKAIYKIITHPNNVNRVFHIYNPNYVSTKKLFNKAKELKFEIRTVNEDEFKFKIKEILEDENKKNILEYLLNDFNNDLHLDYKYDIILKSNFTTKYLRKTFFMWPKISNKYLKRFVKLLKKE